ncbi:hypothetical protein DFJ73DRAFT_875183 [Zopfochytrium polystomum]|nr:hypothetical protein DFJ73DRAFT_875183 [Zopfochytrium polystomum]
MADHPPNTDAAVPAVVPARSSTRGVAAAASSIPSRSGALLSPPSTSTQLPLSLASPDPGYLAVPPSSVSGPPLPIVGPAIRAGLRGIVLGCTVRSSLSVVTAVIRLVGRPSQRSTLPSPLAAFLGSFSDGKAWRFGFFLGGFAFLWKATSTYLWAIRRERRRLHGFVSGFVAGLALLAEKRSHRMAIALQVLTRGLQGVFTSLHRQGIVRVPHGDSFVFILVSAQILHAFATDPTSLPVALHRLIDPSFVPNREAPAKPVPSVVPTSVWVYWNAMSSLFPLYAVLNTAPAAVLQPAALSAAPVDALKKIWWRTARSTNLIALLMSSYRYLLSELEHLSEITGWSARTSDLWCWAAGAVSSTAIFLEDPKRRTEFAVYMFPRGVTTLHTTLYRRGLAPRRLPPYCDVLMFATGMGLIFAYYQSEPDVLGAVVRSLLRAFLRRVDDEPVEAGGRGGRGGKGAAAEDSSGTEAGGEETAARREEGGGRARRAAEWAASLL